MNLIKSGIEMFQQTNPKFLKTIKIVIFDKHFYSIFKPLATESSIYSESPFSLEEIQPALEMPTTSAENQSPVTSLATQLAPNLDHSSMVLKLCSTDEKINLEVRLSSYH